MTPPPPDSCLRQSRWLFILSQLPGIACLLLLFSGHWLAALAIFWATFTLIAIGTVIPRCALFGPLISSLPKGTKGVCLTIDDGPDPETTPRLLDILDQHQAKALFFLIGNRAQKNPDLVREIARRGHAIGNHSQTHPAAYFWTLRPARMWAEVAGCQQTLTQILGSAPVWFRPPVGHHNHFLSPSLRALGLTMLIWNCRGFDAVERDVSRILRRISRSLRPGAVILLHDLTPQSGDVLTATLELIRERGLEVVLPPSPLDGDKA
jgi:peptidoglycan/xylan/chitin deacetylase (PgdA/CDA1 family)